jgi:hypothetical protein
VQDAAELAGDALRLTAAGQGEYDGRLLALARYLISVGEHPRATGLLAGRIGTPAAGPARLTGRYRDRRLRHASVSSPTRRAPIWTPHAGTPYPASTFRSDGPAPPMTS